MKTSIFLISFLVAFSFYGKAQKCEAFIPVEKGEKLMYQTSNKKGKVQSYYSQELLFSKSKDGGVEYGILRKDYDKKKKLTGEDTLIFVCKDNTFYIDMTQYLNKEQMGDYDEAQINFEFENLGYPANMTPGMKLNDGYVKATVIAGIPVMFKTDITNRKVEAKEKITVQAGSFDTFKISQNITAKFGFISVNMSVKTWIAKGVGDVKSEAYDKNGNLISVTELVEFTK